MAPFNQALKFGLITGLILIAYNVVLYAFDVSIFSPVFSILNGLISFGLMIALTVIAINKTRDLDLSGRISYLQALQVGFVVLLVSGYLGNLFSFVLNEYVDPEYMRRHVDNLIYSLEGKVPEETLDTMIEKFEENLVPLKTLIKGFWLTPLIGLVLSAIISIFIKKDKTNLELH
ncbi:MAG: hypothetical protein CVT92_05010 [Bacteroidetes bacterium HGW-Bacteroidetes-1]|jgi:hypothetical protein|nr:MAG: hypothetical protein CVT92_05010 [Bacteroidetes bacterium HGW-Bacteroidetes-1]